MQETFLEPVGSKRTRFEAQITVALLRFEPNKVIQSKDHGQANLHDASFYWHYDKRPKNWTTNWNSKVLCEERLLLLRGSYKLQDHILQGSADIPKDWLVSQNSTCTKQVMQLRLTTTAQSWQPAILPSFTPLFWMNVQQILLSRRILFPIIGKVQDPAALQMIKFFLRSRSVKMNSRQPSMYPWVSRLFQSIWSCTSRNVLQSDGNDEVSRHLCICYKTFL